MAVNGFPCIAVQNATKNVSIATQKSGFAIFNVHKISTYTYIQSKFLEKIELA